MSEARGALHLFDQAPWWRTVGEKVIGYEGRENLVVEVALTAFELMLAGWERRAALIEAKRRVLAEYRKLYSNEGRPDLGPLPEADLPAPQHGAWGPSHVEQAVLDRVATPSSQDVILCWAMNGEAETAEMLDMSVHAVRQRVKDARRKAKAVTL